MPAVANWFRKKPDVRDEAFKRHDEAVAKTREAARKALEALRESGAPEDIVDAIVPQKKPNGRAS